MAGKTTIEWAANADGTPGATWNPIRARDRETGKVGTFCVHHSPGCEHCYAETFQGRQLPGNGIGLAYTAQNLPRVDFYLDEKMLQAPLRRQKPTTWFLSSMTDVAADFVTDEMLDRIFAVVAASPRHLFILLTKRPDRLRVYIEAAALRIDERVLELSLQWNLGTVFQPSLYWPLRNLWVITSIEDQRRADERIPELMATPAAVRGVSCEPLLGPIDFRKVPGFNRPGTALWNFWVIVGGESGAKARPMHPQWARDLRDQCAIAGVPYFYKQTGEWVSILDRDTQDPDWRCDYSDQFAEGRNVQWLNLAGGRGFHGERLQVMRRIGKKFAGRMLDGREHNARPEIRHG
ncbi:MAG: DUF5131 family protein [Hyphomonadaceae bacterium]